MRNDFFEYGVKGNSDERLFNPLPSRINGVYVQDFHFNCMIYLWFSGVFDLIILR